jgi:hypothetical protein
LNVSMVNSLVFSWKSSVGVGVVIVLTT